MSEQTSDTGPSIKVIPNGPYVVSGGVPLCAKTPVKTDDGEPLTWKKTEAATPDGDRYLLCRCGQSSNKPFCDSTHAKIEWDGSETAPTNSYAER
ncbi:MAG: CDGSH iron-sulfur domain-containing protein, partial [Ilumatobacter sp.]|nr:CDGSH iron-sulfur domain-containing protein [Ilumatobacter sp.]